MDPGCKSRKIKRGRGVAEFAHLNSDEVPAPRKRARVLCRNKARREGCFFARARISVVPVFFLYSSFDYGDSTAVELGTVLWVLFLSRAAPRENICARGECLQVVMQEGAFS